MERVWNKKLNAFVLQKTKVAKDGSPQAKNKKTNLPNAGGVDESKPSDGVGGGVQSGASEVDKG